MKQLTFFMAKNLVLIFITLVLSPSVNAISLTGGTNIQKFLVAEAKRQGLDPSLALAIAEVESNFDAKAVSKVGARGVMQIMPATAEGVFGIDKEELFDAKTNIYLGITFIQKLLTRYNQRLDIALSHYNGGSAVQDKFGRLSVIPATRKYVNKVLSAQKRYKNTAYQLSTASTQTTVNLPKDIVKPNKLYSSTSYENSLYKKVEQLRSLRLHNIMRNTKVKNEKTNQQVKLSNHYSRRQSTHRKSMQQQTKRPLSDKRKKVLSWEKIFN